MWNKPTEKDLEAIPALYSSEDVSMMDKVIHMHFFIGGCDWYVSEHDKQVDDLGSNLLFGFAILGGDTENAEWGYMDLEEMAAVRIAPGIEIDRDMHWTPVKASEIPKIMECRIMGANVPTI